MPDAVIVVITLWLTLAHLSERYDVTGWIRVVILSILAIQRNSSRDAGYRAFGLNVVIATPT